jgi:hypothetical protein
MGVRVPDIVHPIFVSTNDSEMALRKKISLTLLVIGIGCSGCSIYFFYSSASFNSTATQPGTDMEWNYAPPRDSNSGAAPYTALLVGGITAIGIGSFLLHSCQKTNSLTLDFTNSKSSKAQMKKTN